MQIGSALIDDTFAEAFTMRYARIVVTADDEHWLQAGLREFCGYSSSVIGCDAEIGIESQLGEDTTPDGRIGAAVLIFGFSADALAKSIPNRVGQCLMTCASTAVYDGLPTAERRIPLGRHIRYFGDGFQKSKVVAGRRYWRIPVMDGEFLVEESLGIEQGVAGGNLILQGDDPRVLRSAARAAAEAAEQVPGVILPFPGGVVRSGSKVGSRYQGLKASTADAFCPTSRGRVTTKLVPAAELALEIVIDGIDKTQVATAMREAMVAAAAAGAIAITAGNYGGELGPHHFHLRELAVGC